MMKIFKLVSVVTLLVITACSHSSEHGGQVASSTTAPLKSSIEVGQIAGGGSWLFDPDSVRDSEFKDALKKSLASQGFLASENAAYRIEADITTHLSTGGANEDRMAEESVDYRVIRLTDMKIFGMTIKTTSTLSGSNTATATGAWGIKKRAAFEKVSSDNLAQFMQKLSTWDLGAN